MRRRFGVLTLGTLVTVGFIVAGAPNVAGANSTLPDVTLVAPANGPLSGGTFVTISGRNFDGATAVDFGSTAAPIGWYVKSPDTIKAIAPADATAQTVVVTVTTSAGSSSSTATATNVFNYVTGPTIQDVTPAVGPTTGGTSVTIAGQDFSCPCGVTFGGVTANFTSDSTTELTAIAPGPENAGTVPVVVSTTAGNTPADPVAQFTYEDDAPIVDSLSPSSGTQGTVVTIIGSRFEKSPKGATTVYFGTTPATGVTVVSSTKITAVAPAESGTVDVTVSDPKGTSPINEPADEFTYTG
ncbi:MAG TPA: IPT/TIG domain-containing protein [Acidimicrobiales bacterium]|nr:IPT/TIG domain-containing protein [Acidimicrobiales bacterium]